MMIKCFDIVDSVIQEADDQFGVLFKINTEKYDILKQYCDIIDLINKEFDVEYIHVSVDEIQMTITVSIGCCDITIESNDHVIYELFKRAVSLEFSVDDDGLLRTSFTFPSIWERTI